MLLHTLDGIWLFSTTRLGGCAWFEKPSRRPGPPAAGELFRGALTSPFAGSGS